MLFLHEMVASPEGDEMSVIGWRRYRHRARAADVGVAQLVRQTLQLVAVEMVIVPQHVVVGRTTGALQHNSAIHVSELSTETLETQQRNTC